MTPSYVFDIDVFHNRIENVNRFLPGIPLVYSIKANPFLVPYLPDTVSHIEACSPGELEICKKQQVKPKKIIYSGVVKEESDIDAAIDYGVDIITAESLRHIELISFAAERRKRAVRVLLRLSSGNQFGMSKDDLLTAINLIRKHNILYVAGLHYYSGTAKDAGQVREDIHHLLSVLEWLEETADFRCEILEYGPGLAAESFAGSDDDCELKDMELLRAVSPSLMELAGRYHLSMESGRFLAAPCGAYETSVADLKTVNGVNYILVDGGTHQIKYHGPNMAMKVPCIEHIRNIDSPTTYHTQDKAGDYTICGSLCTSADILVRNIRLDPVRVGDLLRFKRAGAYSVTEAPALFLSRRMPYIYIQSGAAGRIAVRNAIETYKINKGIDTP